MVFYILMAYGWKMGEKGKEQDFRCKQCGRCCLATDHVDISVKDIELWKGKEGKLLEKYEQILKTH